MNPKIIAFVGKGGVGKTSISSSAIRLLSKAYPDKKILAIDADPAIGLATALGVEETTTVDDIRNLFITSVETGDTSSAVQMLSEAKYRIFDCIQEIENVSFLAIGRPEAAGCYCKVNAYLKEVISMVANNYDFVIIDGEAGIEQVNRRVMEKVTHIVLVSDASAKGIKVCKTIHDVASSLVMYDKCGIIINRLEHEEYLCDVDFGNLDLLCTIPSDQDVVKNDVKGQSVFCLPDQTKLLTYVKKALKKLEIIREED